MTFLCMTAPRKKTEAHISFDNANGRLCQERLLRSRNFATMVTSLYMMSHFSLLNTTAAVICGNSVICLLLSLDAIETGVHLQ